MLSSRENCHSISTGENKLIYYKIIYIFFILFII